MDTSTTTKSFRLPTDLADAITTQAALNGETLTEFVIAALIAHMDSGNEAGAAAQLHAAIRDHLDANYTDGFPVDVTRHVFLHVRDTPAAKALYDQAVAQQSTKAVHTRVGMLIKDHLDARVIGTSNPLPDDELIKTHSLLVPGS